MKRMHIFKVGTIFTLSSFALGITIPVLSLLVLDRGFDLSGLAVVMGAYGIAVVVMEIPSGIIGDTYGRKACFLLAKGCTALGSVLLAIARNDVLFVIAIVSLALARAFISGSFEALVIDWHNERFGQLALHRITTLISIWDTVGLSAGALVAGFVTIGSNRLLALDGPYDGNFLLSGMLNALLFLLSWFWIEESKKGTRRTEGTGFAPVFRFLRHQGLLAALMLSAIATGFILSSIEKYWQPRLLAIGGKQEHTTVLLGLLAFVGFISALGGTILSGHLTGTRKSSVVPLFILWRIVLSGAAIALALSTGGMGYGVSYGLFYLVLGLAGIPEQVMLNRLIPNHLRASVLSVSSFCLQAGGLASSAFAAWFLASEGRGIGELWIISSVVIASALIPFAFRGKRWSGQSA